MFKLKLSYFMSSPFFLLYREMLVALDPLALMVLLENQEMLVNREKLETQAHQALLLVYSTLKLI